MRRRSALYVLPLIVAALPSASALAQEGTRSLDALLECRGVAETAERLRCYDRTADALAGARQSGALVARDRSEVVAAKQRSFGLPAPAQRARAAPAADPLGELAAIDGTIVAVRPAEYGRFLIALDRNGVWKNVEPLGFAPAKGAVMHVVRAGFGGFRATVGKGRSFLVKRER